MRPQRTKVATSADQAAGVSPAPAAPATQEFSADALKALSLGQLADGFGPLDEAVTRGKPVLKQHDAYRKEIERRLDGRPADAQLSIEGSTYKVLIGPRANERKISNRKKCLAAMKRFAVSIYQDLVKFDLKDIDQYVPASEREQFIEQERTGRRTVEAVLRDQS